MCDHWLVRGLISAILPCERCNVIFCGRCGKEWGEGFEVEWIGEEGDIIAINYQCACDGVGKNTGCGCID